MHLLARRLKPLMPNLGKVKWFLVRDQDGTFIMQTQSVNCVSVSLNEHNRHKACSLRTEVTAVVLTLNETVYYSPANFQQVLFIWPLACNQCNGLQRSAANREQQRRPTFSVPLVPEVFSHSFYPHSETQRSKPWTKPTSSQINCTAVQYIHWLKR